jgi:hypothetical protein
MVALSLTGMYFRAEITHFAYASTVLARDDGPDGIAPKPHVTAVNAAEATAIPNDRRIVDAPDSPEAVAPSPESPTARREAQAALLNKAVDEAARLGAPEATAAERTPFRDRADALTRDITMVQRDVAAGPSKASDEAGEHKRDSETATALQAELAPPRQEAEARATALNTIVPEADPVAQTAAAAAAELQKNLQHERDRADTLARELMIARRHQAAEADRRSVLSDEAAQQRRDAETAMAELPQLRTELALAHQQAESRSAELRRAVQEIEEIKRTAATAAVELQQRLQQERDRAEGVASEAEIVRRDAAAQAARTTLETEQSLQRERDKSRALQAELEKARQDIEVWLATTSDEIAGLTQIARSSAAELQEERDKRSLLANSLATTQQDLQAQISRLMKTGEEAAERERSATTVIADLQGALQQERGTITTLESELALARRQIEQAADSPKILPSPPPQGDRATATRRPGVQTRDLAEQPANLPRLEPMAATPLANVAGPTQGAAEVQTVGTRSQASIASAKLLERANALLIQGSIGAARGVLERAAEAGNMQAMFMLAETYDPLVLSTWRTYGTRGDANKARELYAKAYDGGIKAAADRSEALLQSQASQVQPGKSEIETAGRQ